MQNLAKVELHVHLEGTIRPEIAKQLASKNKLPFPSERLDASQQFYHSLDFLDFLHAYDLIAALIRVPEDYYLITYDYLKESAKTGVIYTEMMYSPEHAERVSNIPSREHVMAIDAAIRQAKHDYDIVGTLIITGVRHFGVDSCEAVAKAAAVLDVDSVVGFGLGGDEIHFPPQDFAQAYAIARDAGLKTTIHAGEFADAKSMEQAIISCQVDRIGHGVAAIHSPNTLAMLKDLNIPLELCPSSNIKLGLFKNLSAHPFKQFLEQGINVSINSDDPPFMDTTIAKEYERMQQTFGFDRDELNQITKMAVNHAFIDQNQKEQLLQKLI